MFLNRCYDNTMPALEQTSMNPNANPNMMNTPMMNNCQQPNICPPIMECPQERICHTESYYEVPHIIPINTRIINHHIYRHTYQPCYTSTMEDEISNVYDRPCNF